MTITDLRCDLCGCVLSGAAMLDDSNPRAGVRLFIHPGDPLLRDDQPLVCKRCFDDLCRRLGPQDRDAICAVCGEPVEYRESLHVLEMTGRIGEAPVWQLCRTHAVETLNRFRFIEPKMRPEDLALKADFPSA